MLRDINATLIKEIDRFTDESRDMLLDKVKKKAPKHLRPYIYATKSTSGNERIITIGVLDMPPTTPRTNYTSDDAFAQEYGSPPHPIKPVTRQYLAFQWDVALPQAKHLEDGRVLLTSVNHPGMDAYNNGEGFIRPAIDEWRITGLQKEVPVLKKTLAEGIKSVFSSIKSFFGRGK